MDTQRLLSKFVYHNLYLNGIIIALGQEMVPWYPILERRFLCINYIPPDALIVDDLS